jgi:hypothetical protein
MDREHERLLALAEGFRDVLQTIADHPGDDPTNEEMVPMAEIARRGLMPGAFQPVQCECHGCASVIKAWWPTQLCLSCARADCEHEEP